MMEIKFIFSIQKVNTFQFRYCFIYGAMVLTVVNVLYLSRKLFFNKLASISISVFLNVPNILIHIGMAFSDVLDFVGVAFCKKRYMYLMIDLHLL